MYEKKQKKKAKQLIAFGSALQCSSFCENFFQGTYTYNRTVRAIPQENKYKKYHYL